MECVWVSCMVCAGICPSCGLVHTAGHLQEFCHMCGSRVHLGFLYKGLLGSWQFLGAANVRHGLPAALVGASTCYIQGGCEDL
jgi:hypothetical protein